MEVSFDRPSQADSKDQLPHLSLRQSEVKKRFGMVDSTLVCIESIFKEFIVIKGRIHLRESGRGQTYSFSCRLSIPQLPVMSRADPNNPQLSVMSRANITSGSHPSSSCGRFPHEK